MLAVVSLSFIDGLTFLGSTLYVNTFTTDKIFRIPIGSDGEAGAPVEIALSRPVSHPDGMRAANGAIYLAENTGGRISQLKFDGNRATVTVLKEGYVTPTAVSITANTLWVDESKMVYVQDAKMRGREPGPIKAYGLPLPR